MNATLDTHQPQVAFAAFGELPAGVTTRDIGPGDRDALADAFERLSPESRRRRFLLPKLSLTSRELTYLTDVDHVTHSAIAAFDSGGRMLGVARYAAFSDGQDGAEIAVAIVDEWHGRGLGTALMRRAVARARLNGFTLLRATTLWENIPARALLRGLGFRATGSGGGVVDLELALCQRLAA
jgi:RimJ/RimL family protein N-acetyltransferase